MSNKKENFARFGMAAKGAVYCLIGVLTALAAFGQGGEQTGGKGAMQYLAQQSYGQILLAILGIGLLGYVFWRMYQVFANPKGLDDDAKGYGKRIAYFISGIIYGGFAFYAFKLAFGSNSGSSGSMMGSLMSGSNGDTIAIIIGIGMAIKAIYDLYRAYSNKFREEVEEAGMDEKEQKLLINAGKFGHTSRGAVIGLMAYLTLQSGLASGSKVSTQTDAFSYIQNEFGSIVLGIVAIGFVGYGVYMFIKAKHPAISVASLR
ncbi:DUF1206 domain-containing protein [Christiangramia sabulilitoris]|uniref:DUF1206 domain-containing protein n=1 Tax=Christiangramia sabulilitoris TaxID=2583991 RepID=A0A550I625_9FLAO|nr:DUF1206 domain-containing protein [Christiangramia sabulilitoris]TRO66407.1 DUF1206 domain-containing protein [Christiangramia sabulilitoris]